LLLLLLGHVPALLLLLDQKLSKKNFPRELRGRNVGKREGPSKCGGRSQGALGFSALGAARGNFYDIIQYHLFILILLTQQNRSRQRDGGGGGGASPTA
jgi:hypothetical protein